MILEENNTTGHPNLTTSSTNILGTLINNTINSITNSLSVNYTDAESINTSLHNTARLYETKNAFDIDVTTDQVVNYTYSVTSPTTSSLVTSSATTEIPIVLFPHNSDSIIMAKMTALLVITAVVLVISYRFVVRLFLGYTDRKDDVMPDGLSDEEEDSAVVKRVPEYYAMISAA